MKLLITFGFGIEYRGDGSGILAHEQVAGLKEICIRAISLFGGYTASATYGAWRDPDTNLVVSENGRTISVLVDEGWGVDEMVQQIKASLQQKAVAVTRTEVQFDFL